MSDVLVIGGGMAGVIAALRARTKGASVTLARRALGATAMSSGAVDVALPRGESLALASALTADRPEHPLRVLHADAGRMVEALRFASEATAGLIGFPGDSLLYLPTAHGTFKAAASAQRSQLPGALSGLPSVVGVVGFRATPIIDARFVAKGLQADAKALGRDIQFVPIESAYFNELEDALRQPVELATRFDRADAVAALSAELSSQDAAAFLLPPILGFTVAGVSAALALQLKRPCAELLSDAHGSVPGLRLHRALDEALVRAGVRVIDATVVSRDGVLFAGEERIDAAAVVLASGKFIGGGIRRDGVLRETVYGAPVYVNDRRGPGARVDQLLGERYGDDQPIFRAGVRIDARLRPLGARDEPVHEKLFAAGSVIAGFDPAVDVGGLGMCVFSGYLAGEQAPIGWPTL